MFQAYLWLCVLQGNLDAIEQELFVLCDLVYRGIGIPWEMASQATVYLVAEIMQNLKPSDQKLLDPYAYGLIKAFATAGYLQKQQLIALRTLSLFKSLSSGG